MKEIIAIFIRGVGWKSKAKGDFRRAEEQTMNGHDVIIMYHELESEETMVFINQVAMIKFKEVK